jgi:hypothetical protein
MQERTSISIDAGLLKRLRKLSKDTGHSLSAVIERLCLEGVGEAEFSTAASRDPLTQALIAEMLRPENLSRAAKIVGETTDDPDLFRRRAEVLGQMARKAAGHK